MNAVNVSGVGIVGVCGPWGGGDYHMGECHAVCR